MGLDPRAIAAGFLGALVVLGVLLWVVGIDGVLDTLIDARRRVLPAVLVAAAFWLAAWALALRTVLDALDVRISVPRAVLVYASAVFANNVTPFGQAGGEPLTAFVIAGAADTEYETGLAAIASTDSVNFVPSTAMALAGAAYLSFEVALAREVRVSVAGVAVLAVVLPAVGYAGWRYRDRLERAVARLVVPVSELVGERLSDGPILTRASIERRIQGFFRAIEVVATDRRTLGVALGFSTLGWLAQALSLWLALYSLGAAVPWAAVLVAVPLGALGGVTPLPGGLGGIEAILVAILVPTAGVAAATAAAGVVVHRAATYWLPTLAGGGAIAALGTETRHQQR